VDVIVIDCKSILRLWGLFYCWFDLMTMFKRNWTTKLCW